MATCRVCGAEVPGRRWKCDDCKAAGKKSSDEPTTLGSRGRRLYAALVDDKSSVQRKVLAEEAARITDRLDELDRIIHGRGVLELMQFRVLDTYTNADGDVLTLNVKVQFQSVLGEARQQAGRLAGIVNQLGLESLVPVKTEPTKGQEANPLAQILTLVQPPS